MVTVVYMRARRRPKHSPILRLLRFCGLVAIWGALAVCKGGTEPSEPGLEHPAGGSSTQGDDFDRVLAARKVELPTLPAAVTRLKESQRPVRNQERWTAPLLTVSPAGVGDVEHEPTPLACLDDLSSCKLMGAADPLAALAKLPPKGDSSSVWIAADAAMPLGVMWPILNHFRDHKRTPHFMLKRQRTVFALRVEAGEALPLWFDPRSGAVQSAPQQLRQAGQAKQVDPRFDAPRLAPGVLVHVRETKLDVPVDCNPQASKRHARRLISAFTGCYRDATARGVGKAGDVLLTWNTNPDGSVLSASVKKNTASDDSFAECLVLSLKSSQFPPHERSADQCAMSYQLRMEPSDQESWVEAGEHPKRYPTRFLIGPEQVRVQNNPGEPEVTVVVNDDGLLLKAAEGHAKSSGYALLVADDAATVAAVTRVAAIAFQAGFDRIVIGKPGNFR